MDFDIDGFSKSLKYLKDHEKKLLMMENKTAEEYKATRREIEFKLDADGVNIDEESAKILKEERGTMNSKGEFKENE